MYFFFPKLNLVTIPIVSIHIELIFVENDKHLLICKPAFTEYLHCAWVCTVHLSDEDASAEAQRVQVALKRHTSFGDRVRTATQVP